MVPSFVPIIFRHHLDGCRLRYGWYRFSGKNQPLDSFWIESNNIIKNGILSLKGGDLTEELRLFPEAEIYYLNNYFHESFFETKKIVHLPI